MRWWRRMCLDPNATAASSHHPARIGALPQTPWPDVDLRTGKGATLHAARHEYSCHVVCVPLRSLDGEVGASMPRVVITGGVGYIGSLACGGRFEAVGTKWNCLPFRPGLMVGRYISVDAYYLTPTAPEVGHHLQVILTGHRTNEGWGAYVADHVIKPTVRGFTNLARARVLVLAPAFQEKCPDLRNTRVGDIVHALEGYSAQVAAAEGPARIRHHPDQSPGAWRVRRHRPRRGPRAVPATGWEGRVCLPQGGGQHGV